MSVEQFEKISSKFNSSFKPSDDLIKEAENKLAKIAEKKNEIVQTAENTLILKDQEYIIFEIKSLIEDTRNVMTTLKDSLKEGSFSTMFEAYGNLAKSVTAQLHELIMLNKMIADGEMFRGKGLDEPKEKENTKVTGVEMLDLLIEIRNQAKSKKVDIDDIEFDEIKTSATN